jgi:hypothetical protein
MIRKINYSLLLVASVILGACTSGEETSADAVSSCAYSYDQENSVLEWTAFKFTEKAPVKGTFNSIQVDGLSSAESAKELIESLSFSIETGTVETQNEERNGKIAKYYFETTNTPKITGKVKSLSDNGKATFEITMNGKPVDVVGVYTVVGKTFSFTATIDVAKWDSLEGIDTLNEICKDLHTGADGKSKLWSEIDLSFTTTLKKECK